MVPNTSLVSALAEGSRAWTARLLCLALVIANGCSDGNDGPPGPPGKDLPINTKLTKTEDLPGLVVEVLGLSGGSGPNGNFRAGDKLRVTFKVSLKNGRPVPLAELNLIGMYAAGPSSNYNPILARVTDQAATSVANADGSWTYTFAAAIPATYLAPLNDSTAFGLDDGELQGQALLDGTYTLGIEMYKIYDVEGEDVRDVANATVDFLVGNATAIEARAVVGDENCNNCHSEVRLHGGTRREVKLCLLCHTAGAEDWRPADQTQPDPNPGVSIDFKVMIHRIHNGAHLPSVLGVATNNDGSRNYAATKKPYTVRGRNGSVHDYSEIGFPVWPNLNVPLPRDQGFTTLNATNQGTENTIRSGAAACAKCHGDPDGSGPKAAPAQGGLAFSKSTRVACGTCHDDIDWHKPYTANLLTMPPQADDATCAQCHPASGAGLSVEACHLHPILDPNFNKGLVATLTAVSESGTNNANGKFDPGEKVRLSFTIRDDNGLDVAPSTLSRMEVVISGPTTNRNVILETTVPVAALTSSAPSIHAPMPRYLELAGKATSTANEVFTTAFTPHWNVSGALTSVMVRTATSGGSSTLSAAAPVGTNYVDVAAVTGFARGDYVVVDDGVSGKEEYLRVQFVDGSRLWFSSIHSPYSQPELRYAHDSGATVREVTLTGKTVTTDYTLNAAAGTITEVTEFGDGNAVLVSYTTDFVVPPIYPATINDSPALGEDWGDWSGKSLVAGTYTVTMWLSRSLTLNRNGETNSYPTPTRPVTKDVLFGSATKLVPNTTISSANNCYACHDDLYFHGGNRRGYETCIACHGTAGSEDRPRYVAGNAPATDTTSIDFRQMLHRIHHGHEMANGSTWLVNGFSSAAYPNNYTSFTYEHIGFPALDGGTRNCATCHGTSTAWQAPVARNHPTEQVVKTRSWGVSCGSCHDSDEAQAHIASQTTAGGAEACATCHGAGKTEAVDIVLKIR
jgi:OmcA/MtrC family decaheme c-type cytochrome